MANKIEKSFFKAPEVLFVGYSQTNQVYCDMIKSAFEESGAKVYPVNPKGSFDGSVIHKSVEEVPANPQLAYVTTNKSITAGLLDGIAAKGVKRVIFSSSTSGDQAMIDRCKSLGMEAAVACPMMGLGKGIHRFHGWLAGVR